MKNKKEVKEQLQRAVNALCKFKCYEEELALTAQKLGLQAEKRRCRLNSVIYHNLINYFRCDAFDYAHIELSLEIPEVRTKKLDTPEEFLKEVMEYMHMKKETFHEVGNNLVLLFEKGYAEDLYKLGGCLKEDIKYVNRTIDEGVLSHWDESFMLLRQTTAADEHDCLEKREAEYGYKY